MNTNNLKIIQLSKDKMDDVIELLQAMSDFRPSKDEHDLIWKEFSEQNNVFSFIATLEDKVVGYGSLLIETKIRGGKWGHVEDIVSHKNYRNLGVGKSIVDFLLSFAKDNGCYKVSLQCSNEHISFYKKCGYNLKGVSMEQFI